MYGNNQGVSAPLPPCPLSDQIRNSFFHAAELPDAEPEEEGGDGEAEAEDLPVDGRPAAEEAPAETVDAANHGIERVEKPPFFRDDPAGEADGRNVETELNEEGDDDG